MAGAPEAPAPELVARVDVVDVVDVVTGQLSQARAPIGRGNGHGLPVTGVMAGS